MRFAGSAVGAGPACHCIGQEVTEQLDYEPARIIRRRLVRRTFVHRTDKDLAPITAPLPRVFRTVVWRHPDCWPKW